MPSSTFNQEYIYSELLLQSPPQVFSAKQVKKTQEAADSPSSASTDTTTLSLDTDFVREQAEMFRRFKEEQESTKKASLVVPAEAKQLNPQEHEKSSEHVSIKDMLQDEDLVRAQNQLYNDLEKMRLGRVSPVTTATRPYTETVTREPAASARYLSEMGTHEECLTREKFQGSLNDSVQHLANGKKLRLKGMHHAYRSAAEGTDSVISCPSCYMHLQVPQSAKAVYCIVCHQVFSTTAARRLPSATTPQQF